MSKPLKALWTGLLCLCLLLSAAFSSQSRAGAETPIDKVLATTSYTPVALMEVAFITAATSTEGCYVSYITWYDENYQPETDYFGTGLYHLEICLEAYEGYVFSEGLSAYLNNSAVDVSRDETGRSVVLKRDFTPAIWPPNIIKHPGAETVTEGGWASFVVSATYAQDYKWSVKDPGGRSLACSEIGSMFPGVSVDGDGSGKILIYNIPMEMDGWSVVCTFTGPGGSVTSNGALVTVKPDPAKATPEPTPEPTPSATPSPAPTESPEPTAPAEHSHEFSEDWSYDNESHWHECSCGGKSGQEPHQFQWSETVPAGKDQAGLEEGLCAVCGHSQTRELPASSGSSLSMGGFRAVLFSILGLVFLALVLLIVQTVRESRRRKRRRK